MSLETNAQQTEQPDNESYLTLRTTLPDDDREILERHLKAAIDELGHPVAWSCRSDAESHDDLWDWHGLTIALGGEER